MYSSRDMAGEAEEDRADIECPLWVISRHCKKDCPIKAAHSAFPAAVSICLQLGHSQSTMAVFVYGGDASRVVESGGKIWTPSRSFLFSS